jgi:hypothetical protein
MSVQTRIVLATVSTFNAFLLGLLGLIALRFVDGVAAPAGAATLWLGALTLVAISRRLRRPVEWG